MASRPPPLLQLLACPRFHRPRRKPLTGVSRSRSGHPSALTCTAARKGRVVRRAAPTLALACLSTQIGVIEFLNDAQRPAVLPLAHRLHQLMLDYPCAVVAHTPAGASGPWLIDSQGGPEPRPGQQQHI